MSRSDETMPREIWAWPNGFDDRPVQRGEWRYPASLPYLTESQRYVLASHDTEIRRGLADRMRGLSIADGTLYADLLAYLEGEQP